MSFISLSTHNCVEIPKLGNWMVNATNDKDKHDKWPRMGRNLSGFTVHTCSMVYGRDTAVVFGHVCTCLRGARV